MPTKERSGTFTVIKDADRLKDLLAYGQQASELSELLTKNQESQTIFALQIPNETERYKLTEIASRIVGILPIFPHPPIDKIFFSLDSEKPIIYFSRSELK